MVVEMEEKDVAMGWGREGVGVGSVLSGEW